jgi:hypothetical protein
LQTRRRKQQTFGERKTPREFSHDFSSREILMEKLARIEVIRTEDLQRSSIFHDVENSPIQTGIKNLQIRKNAQRKILEVRQVV